MNVQDFVFIVLSEKFHTLSVQHINYLVIISKMIGRATFFCIVSNTKRKSLNFTISGVILFCSSFMLLMSFLIEKDSLDFMGVAVAGKIFLRTNYFIFDYFLRKKKN